MGLEVVKDNTEEAVDAIGSAIAAALEEVGLAAEGYAKAAVLAQCRSDW